MSDNSERLKFPKEVRNGRAITVYNKEPSWTSAYDRSVVTEATDDIVHWFASQYGFKRERVLDQLEAADPSLSVTFSSEGPPARNNGFWMKREMDMKKVLDRGFAVGYHATYTNRADRIYGYIVIPSDRIGHFGRAAQNPEAQTLVSLDSHYVTETQIHPFYLYDKEFPEKIVGQDPHRVLVKVDLLTAEQFLAQYQLRRRGFWRTQNQTLNQQKTGLLSELTRIDQNLADYQLDKLDEMDTKERELLPYAIIPSPVYA